MHRLPSQRFALFVTMVVAPQITRAEPPAPADSAGARRLADRYTSTVRSRRAVEQPVSHTLSAEEVKHIPGTQGDTIKAVQNLPGVARPPFGGGLIVVWGSAPQDT